MNTGIARIAGIEFDNMIFRFCTFVCLQTKRGVPAIQQYFIGCPGLPAGVQANYDHDDDDDDDGDEDDDGDANDHGMVTRSMGREVLYLM